MYLRCRVAREEENERERGGERQKTGRERGERETERMRRRGEKREKLGADNAASHNCGTCKTLVTLLRR